jgi:hypothetical protein
MSTFLRLRAAAASIIVISAAFGFGVAANMLAASEPVEIAIGSGPDIASPGSSRENIETRSIAGYRSAALATRSLSAAAYPAINPQGPAAGNVHADLGPTRSLAAIATVSACLMAMN